MMADYEPSSAARAQLTIETCWMCGIRLPAYRMMPDGGSACATIRWYCVDVLSCTERWVSSRSAPDGAVPARPAPAHAGAAGPAPARPAAADPAPASPGQVAAGLGRPAARAGRQAAPAAAVQPAPA